MGKRAKPSPEVVMALSNQGLAPSEVDERLHLDDEEARRTMVELWQADKAHAAKQKKRAA